MNSYAIQNVVVKVILMKILVDLKYDFLNPLQRKECLYHNIISLLHWKIFEWEHVPIYTSYTTKTNMKYVNVCPDDITFIYDPFYFAFGSYD